MSPAVLSWNAETDASRQPRISAALGQPGVAAATALDGFIRGLGMPRRLSEVGVSENQLPLIAEYTLKDIWGRTNPRTISSAADVMAILARAL
jgi:alcohol dehydrogenase class IV